MAVLTWTVLTITCGVLCAPTNWDSSSCGSRSTSLGRLYAAGDWDSCSCCSCSFSHGRLCTTADCQRRGGNIGEHCREKPHNIAQAYHTELCNHVSQLIPRRTVLGLYYKNNNNIIPKPDGAWVKGWLRCA